MTADEAESYHAEQISWFADTDVQLVTCGHLVDRRRRHRCDPGRCASRPPRRGVVHRRDRWTTAGRDSRLATAINETDNATGGQCCLFHGELRASRTTFAVRLESGGGWRARIGGIRANASRMSHAELDEADTLDAGNPAELGRDYAVLMRLLPNLRVFGGCCGTDHRHVEAIADCCLSRNAA